MKLLQFNFALVDFSIKLSQFLLSKVPIRAVAPADAVPELEVALWLGACGCCRFSILWSGFSLTRYFLADEKSMSLALAYGTSSTYVGKIHEQFILRASELFMNSCSCL